MEVVVVSASVWVQIEAQRTAAQALVAPRRVLLARESTSEAPSEPQKLVGKPDPRKASRPPSGSGVIVMNVCAGSYPCAGSQRRSEGFAGAVRW